MSSYSSLIGKVKIKEKFKKDVIEVTYGNGWNWCETHEMLMFSNVEDCESIPHHIFLGELKNESDTNFDEESRMWTFKFSINNDDGTIDSFIELLYGISDQILYINKC